MHQLTDEQLYKLCQEYGQAARIAQRQFAALLDEVYKRRLYKKKGYGSIYEFAAKLAGMSYSAVDTVLSVHKKLEDKPILKDLMAEYGWGKLKVISTVATKETQEFWAEKVQGMSSAALQKFVHETRLSKSGDDVKLGIDSSNPGDTSQKTTLSFKLDPKTEVRLRIFRQKLEKQKGEPVDWNQTFRRLLLIAEKQEQIPKQRKNKKYIKTTRYIPVSVRNELQQKYRGQCAFPGCKFPAEINHHTRRYALVPNHDPEYIVPLCKEHERVAHLGLIENEEKAPKYWKVRLLPDTSLPKYKIDQKVKEYYNTP